MDRIEVPANPTPQEPTPGYNQQVIDRAEGKINDPGQETLLAGKYKTDDELAKGTLELLKKQYNGDLVAAYKELEKKGFTSQEPAKPAESQQNEPQDPNNAPQSATDQVVNIFQSLGLDQTRYTKEYAETGSLSEQSFKELEAKGFDRQTVNFYLRGMKAEADELFNVIGGREQWDVLSAWAENNLSDSEVDAINKGLAGNINQQKMALETLKMKYEAKKGTSPKPIMGDNAFVTGDVYRDIDEWKRDVANPLYKTSPAFREKVAQKIGRSNII